MLGDLASQRRWKERFRITKQWSQSKWQNKCAVFLFLFQVWMNCWSLTPEFMCLPPNGEWQAWHVWNSLFKVQGRLLTVSVKFSDIFNCYIFPQILGMSWISKKNLGHVLYFPKLWAYLVCPKILGMYCSPQNSGCISSIDE